MSPSADTTTDRVAEAATVAGLRLNNDFDAAALESLSGPFITMDSTDDEGVVVATIAVRDDFETADDLLASLVAVMSAWSGSSEQPAAADPVPDGGAITARFATPIDVVALSDEAGVITAVLVKSVDRRGTVGAGESEPAAAAPAPVRSGDASKRIGGLDKLSNVTLEVSVELGRCTVTLAEVLDYDIGSIVELDRAVGSPVDVRVNGTLLARGEVVVIDDEYAVRITDVCTPRDE